MRLSLTGAQREKLDFKQMVVLDYQDFKATYPKAEIIQNAEQQLHIQTENQRDEDEALYKSMTGG